MATWDVYDDIVRVAKAHGWAQEESGHPYRLILARQVGTRSIRMWVDLFASREMIKRVLVADGRGDARPLRPTVGHVLAYLKEYGS